MRGLTLLEPWASLMADGHKTIETRSWSTKYRGLVAIHSSKNKKGVDGTMTRLAYDAGWNDRKLRSFMSLVEEWPGGRVIAVGKLVECFSTNDISGQAKCIERGSNLTELMRLERFFGNYSADRFCWLFQDIRRIQHPFDKRGSLGLWKFDADMAATLERWWREANIR